MRLPLTKPRIVLTIVLISLSCTTIYMTTHVNGASTSSPQCTLPSQQQTSKRSSCSSIPNDDRSLIALNVVPQYTDDDFTIPSINNLIRSDQRHYYHHRPPIMQRFLQKVASKLHPSSYFTSSFETSSTTAPVANFVIVAYIVSSFGRVAFQKLLQLSGRRPKDDVVVPNNTNTVDPTMIEVEDWKDMYDHIHLEVKNLRQQILDLTEKLEQEQNQKLEAIKVELKEEKELNDSIQYWKDMVQKKDEEMKTKLQIERQNNLQQLEQLKSQMTQVVDEERRNMYTEFTSMVQQLRESLNLVPVSSTTD